MSILLKRETSGHSVTVAYKKHQNHIRHASHYEQAIEIDPPDEQTYDVEAGLTSSTCALMHNFEEERPKSLVISVKESARSSTRKAKYYCSYVFSPIRRFISTFKLLIIIAIYSFLGAHLFMYLEVPADLESREEMFHKRKIAREVMVLNLRAIYWDNREDREERWKHAILRFESDSGLDEPEIETAWTFWMSFLYAGTIFTTIGYGNIACKTRAGQVATMIYAFVGIPIMLVMLNSLNNFLLKWIKITANAFSDITLFCGVRLGLVVIRQDEIQKRLRYTQVAKKMQKWGFSKSQVPGNIAITNSEEGRLNSKNDEDEEDEEIEPDPPVFSTLFATVGWIMLSAAIFCLFEDWTFFTSFYFCFISLTTIGLGDVTPANPQYMIATFGVVLVGLSMLTVCIDVIKEKLALMYMALLQKLLKEYMEALESGDPNAASAMMAGFQGKAKFLMPLLSKNEGAKVMNRFKEDCSKKGIEVPHVLSDINPETGMPAFANASKEEFNDYIEVAEERFIEEQQRVGSPTAPTPVSRVSFASGPALIPDRVQKMEFGSQTYQEISSDEGIQTDYSSSGDDKECQTPTEMIISALPRPVLINIGTQFETFSPMIETGIQPEVSAIYLGIDYESESESSEEETEEEEGESIIPHELEDVELLQKGIQSPPIEITAHFLDDDHIKDEEIVLDSKKLGSMNKVEKSASIDSAETVIHVDNRKLLKKKKPKEKKKRDRELRFLKSCGNQTSPILLDCATQYEIGIEVTRNRRCQTKLSSINQEQLRGIRESIDRKKRRISEGTSLSGVSFMDDGEEVAEISLDLSLVALGVDEEGKVIDIPAETVSKTVQDVSKRRTTSEITTETSPDISHWTDDEDDLESLQELELFSTEAGSQTDQTLTAEKEISVNPWVLEAMQNCASQTTIELFQPRTRRISSASSSSEEKMEIGVQTFEGLKTIVASTSYDAFVEEVECQTDEKVFEDQNCQTDVEEKKEEVDVHDTESQTICTEIEERMMQTDGIGTSEIELQTDREEVLEIGSQTEVPTIHIKEVQTDSDTMFTIESHSQTEEKTNEGKSIQTDSVDSPDTFEIDSQTEIFVSEVEIQTDDPSQSKLTSDVDLQTDVLQLEVCSSQTDEVSKEQMETQTDYSKIENTFSQTDGILEAEFLKRDTAEEFSKTLENIAATIETQTEIFTEEIDCQTDRIDSESIDCQTEGNKTLETAFQTDSLIHSGEEKETQVEIPLVLNSETQYSLELVDNSVQAEPILVDSDTQHSFEYKTQSCQTSEATKKNRRIQDLEDQATSTDNLGVDTEIQVEVERSSVNLSPIKIDTEENFTMTDDMESFFEEKEVQVDEDSLEKEDETNVWAIQSSGPLWSDFDYTPIVTGFEETEEEPGCLDDETQTGEDEDEDEQEVSDDFNQDEPRGEKNFEEMSVQAIPESNDAQMQTVKFKKRKAEKTVEAKVEMSTSTCQATVDVAEQSAGDVEEDWLQVYVQELDEERRLRMSDIGIQTGVLARVQHMYTRPIIDTTVTGTSGAPITLRKTSDSEEEEEETTGSKVTSKGSEESLAPSTSALSVSESADEKSWIERSSPFSSRQSSVKHPARVKQMQDVERKTDRSNIVNDLRARFESKSPTPKSPSPTDQSSSSSKRQFFQ